MTPLFVINVYKNADQANALAKKLVNLYPQSSVALIDDEREHLKTPDKAGQWTERWLRSSGFSMDYPPDVCIKIDPDVTPNKAVTEFPDADVFGAISVYQGGAEVIRGGAMGITHAAAQKILDSGLLLDKKYTDLRYSYKSGRMRNGPVVSYQDAIFSDVVHRLGLKVAEWHEVHAHTRQAPRHENYAFINEFFV